MFSERKPFVPITVPAELRNPHPLVAELRTAAKGAQEDKGVLALNYSKVLRVRTSRQCLARALILIDTLIKEFESQGYKVRLGDRAETELIVGEGAISFRLDERTKRVAPPPPPPRPKGGRQTSFYEPWRPAFVLVATGEFTLSFERYRLHGCRQSWRDRSGAMLESQLHEVMEAIPTWEAALKAQRLERESFEQEVREAEARRVALAREAEILRRQRARLVENLIAWENAERLRRFIATVEEVSEESESTQAWLAWAKGQVLMLDPLSSKLADATSLDIKLEHHFRGLPAWEKTVKDWWSS